MAKQPDNHREGWPTSDVSTLKKLAKTRPVGIIAHELDRSGGAVRSKAEREGISLAPPERSPYGRPTKSKLP